MVVVVVLSSGGGEAVVVTPVNTISLCTIHTTGYGDARGGERGSFFIQ